MDGVALEVFQFIESNLLYSGFPVTETIPLITHHRHFVTRWPRCVPLNPDWAMTLLYSPRSEKPARKKGQRSTNRE